MRRILLEVIAISLAGLAACNPFAPDQSVILDVDALSAPASITPGSSLTVILSVTTGGCTIFDHIAVLRRPASVQLAAIGRNTAKGRPNVTCPDVIRVDPHSYTLSPPFESPFLVKVERATAAALTATVTIQ
ncbi:MAG TPA: hypothetical protein VGO75_14320 [Gemmatimonadaceae bacterium]|jgi:hypothetical protein|nr:hypothetical protein [Gemmatimonadaceae bacterium]